MADRKTDGDVGEELGIADISTTVYSGRRMQNGRV